jgi:hypothetical protein
MAYRPTAGRLTVGIFSARNLKKMDVNGKSGKCEMFYSFEFVQKSVEMENYI